MEQTAEKTIPESAFLFHNIACQAEFADGDDGKKDPNKVRLTMYDGSINYHWYWGNFSFELDSMKLSKKRIAILGAHNDKERLGYSTGATFDKKFVLEGKFLENSPTAAEYKRDIADGFPFEASLSFDPSQAIIENIPENVKTQVNGQTLVGPGTVIKNAVIREGSICTLGALKNCVTEKFIKNNRKDVEMSKEKQTPEKGTIEFASLSVEDFATQAPDLYDKILNKGKADGEKGERDRFAELAEVCGDDTKLLVEKYSDGSDKVEALKARNEKLQIERDEAREQAKKAKPAAAGVTPAAQEFSDADDGAGEGAPEANTKEAWEKEYKESKDLQSEFGDVKNYIAFKEADSKGQVKIKDK